MDGNRSCLIAFADMRARPNNVNSVKAPMTILRNEILNLLPTDERSELLIYGKEVSLYPGSILQASGETIEHVFFPHSGLASLIVVVDGVTAEAGFVSRKGAIGSLYSIENPTALSRAVVVAGGAAFRVPRQSLEHMLRRSDALQQAINQNNVQIAENAQRIAGCNLLHHLDARLCRWLLQVHDAGGIAEIAITQDALAQMLGVNRQRLNEALRDLQTRKAITSHRAEIRIVRVDTLFETACRCATPVPASVR
ncbi:Crp/Fnr family transcriptional regulator [Tardiphaga sp. vice154]|uniref:Crp/Fnr family transcriptional regulator n=1 Tax=Tardiphaga sp. vice154 TaxID=2592814 RepID=UPI001163B703|nr:Crp/Fnr family transcriptional regulator [Tardiphaga sp. vice154]QDM24185.1 Crp/Fnr family transcriptional regulator [Tardiphaga sp. vice154]